MNEPVVPDPLLDYTDDEKAVARAIVAGELEIPSLVEYVKTCGHPGSRRLYFHRCRTLQLSKMHGKWPLGDKPCYLEMARIRECVRLMLEHPEEVTSPKGRN
jgi:hypothetical protein